jgi:hypothetical protein
LPNSLPSLPASHIYLAGRTLFLVKPRFEPCPTSFQLKDQSTALHMHMLFAMDMENVLDKFFQATTLISSFLPSLKKVSRS